MVTENNLTYHFSALSFGIKIKIDKIRHLQVARFLIFKFQTRCSACKIIRRNRKGSQNNRWCNRLQILLTQVLVEFLLKQEKLEPSICMIQMASGNPKYLSEFGIVNNHQRRLGGLLNHTHQAMNIFNRTKCFLEWKRALLKNKCDPITK